MNWYKKSQIEPRPLLEQALVNIETGIVNMPQLMNDIYGTPYETLFDILNEMSSRPALTERQIAFLTEIKNVIEMQPLEDPMLSEEAAAPEMANI
jgi:hypothetical protein|tara:strand:+ start:160 stop:444 length:285 start_codon:yes stop_codon:yes gene_type:complete